MTNRTTFADEFATLTEQQLFNRFAEGEVEVEVEVDSSEGTALRRIAVKDLFDGFGNLTNKDLLSSALKDLQNDPDPARSLEELLLDLESLVSGVALAHDGFQDMLKVQNLAKRGDVANIFRVERCS